jgi:hypothetical protein
MKKNLGNLILFFLPIYLFGSSLCDISTHIDKNKILVNEYTILTITAKQKDKHSAMFFEFINPKIDSVKFKLLNKIEKKDKHQDTFVTFRYKLIVKKSGNIEIPLSLKVKQASFESVNSFNTGSADELESLKTKDTIIKLSPIKIEVKDLEKKVQLIGDFKLTYKIDKKNAKAYEPIYASYDIKGKGTHQDIKTFFYDLNDVDIFLDKRGELGFDYVFISDKNFTIPAIKISCYSPSKKRYYSLNIPKNKITITKSDQKKLLDDTDSFPSSSYNLSEILVYFNALLIFIAGYLSSHFNLFKRVQKVQYRDDFKDKITECKNKKDLLKLLLSKNEKRYLPFIKELEECIYEGKKESLRSIKERLSKL